jgi:Spy/CpxP family protein refolding chaperone
MAASGNFPILPTEVERMKKRTVLLALAAVLVIGTAAYAHGGGFGGMGGFGPGMGFDGSDRVNTGNRNNMMHRNAQDIQIPQDIKDKMQEMQRTNLEMRLALSQEKPDVNKARLLFGKVQKLQNELSKWRFERYLETISK